MVVISVYPTVALYHIIKALGVFPHEMSCIGQVILPCDFLCHDFSTPPSFIIKACSQKLMKICVITTGGLCLFCVWRSTLVLPVFCHTSTHYYRFTKPVILFNLPMTLFGCILLYLLSCYISEVLL